ncbi:MAG: selenoneine synthase SenA [Thermoanaerobaculia bacterium]
MISKVDSSNLIDALRDARSLTLRLAHSLSRESLDVPCIPIVNPPLWELGHVGWFQEKWTLRNLRGRPPHRTNADQLYDSSAIPHDTRWCLPLPGLGETLEDLQVILDGVISELQIREPTDELRYFHLLALFHEDMHDEAFVYTRQTLGLPSPFEVTSVADAGPLTGNAEIPGGEFMLGASLGESFVFDNEKWAHRVSVPAFRIARAAVTNGEFAEFVEARGYANDAYWSEDGRVWRDAAAARHPVYWRHGHDGSWEERRWDRWETVREHRPIIHVNAFEAEAYCAWKGRRLPTEAEWELAASRGNGGEKRRMPWGDEMPDASRANVDCSAGGPVDVGAFAAGDTVDGVRQMIGNVWEWTSSRFLPYPGFAADPYRDYSEPWFASPHRALRGGAWTTRGRLLRNTWRNFYEPHRNDVLAGFRTCAK